MGTTVHTVGVAGGHVVAGNIAARIDRLPLIWVQYLLAAITQIYWGIIIDADGFISRIYPFVWQPLGMTVVEFSVILASNIGAGILVGEYLGGYLSDRFGRRSVLLASAVIVGGLMWPIALTNSTGWLLLWNFSYAIGMGFMLATNAVYLHEVAPPGTRHRLAMRTQLLTAVCGLLPSVLAFALIPARYQWFVYGLALAQFVILVPLGLLLPESPRWLESKGRVHEADRIVTRWERWAERRRGPLPEPAAERHPVVQVRRVPARELFRGEYGRRTVLVLAVWLIGYPGIVYGGVTYIVTYLAGHGWSAPEVFLWTGIVAAPCGSSGSSPAPSSASGWSASTSCSCPAASGRSATWGCSSSTPGSGRRSWSSAASPSPPSGCSTCTTTRRPPTRPGCGPWAPGGPTASGTWARSWVRS